MKNLLVVFSLFILGVSAGIMYPMNPDDGCPPGQVRVGQLCAPSGKRSFIGHPENRCQPGTMTVGKNCVRIPSRMAKCSTDFECGQSQICVDGKCRVNNGLGGLCSADSQCPSGFICIDGKCKKSNRRFLPCTAECLPGQKCINGVCQSVPMFAYGGDDGSCEEVCIGETVCHNGKCTKFGFHSFARSDLPCIAECLPGQKCINGVCQSISMFRDDDADESCPEGCPEGFVCYEGRCIRIKSNHFARSHPICTAPCLPGQRCVNGGCESIPMRHQFQSSGDASCPKRCPFETICMEGRCVDHPIIHRSAPDQPDDGCPPGQVRVGQLCAPSGKPFRRFLPCTAPCLPGQKCIDGVCQSIPMFHGVFKNQNKENNASCPENHKCVANVCQLMDPNYPLNDGTCPKACEPTTICRNGGCIIVEPAPRCHDHCPLGEGCVYGECKVVPKHLIC